MDFDQMAEFGRIRRAWESVQIARNVPYSLFTFGRSDLPYYLVCGAKPGRSTVTVRRGEVQVDRPMIITPDSAPPALANFFDDPQEEHAIRFLLARLATFSNMKLDNCVGSEQIVTSSVEEAVERIGRELDAQDEDRIAILTSPPRYAGVAVLRYAVERILRSAPENLRELQEHGWLPEL